MKNIPLYISKIFLNLESYYVQEDLKDRYLLYSNLRKAFSVYDYREQAKILYRIDEQADPFINGIPILVQSTVLPIWTHLSKLDSYFIKEPITKEVNNIKISDEMDFQFVLHASPVQVSREKHLLRLHNDQLLRWIVNKGDLNGFYIEKDEIQIKKFPPAVAVKSKGGQTSNLNISIVEYSGILHVNNKILFTNAMINGIGRGKEFGCGLLSIASRI